MFSDKLHEIATSHNCSRNFPYAALHEGVIALLKKKKWLGSLIHGCAMVSFWLVLSWSTTKLLKQKLTCKFEVLKMYRMRQTAVSKNNACKV